MGEREVSVLGRTVLTLDGTVAALRPREAAVLAALVHVDGPAPVDVLVDLLWTAPPATAPKAVHNHVSRLRRIDPDVVVTGRTGYRLGPGTTTDRHRFEGLVADGPPHDAEALAAALDRWVGPAYADLGDHPGVEAERARLAELRLVAEERLVAIRLLAGEDPVADAERLVAAEPYRERRWWLVMLARHRGGRRRDALDAFQQARRALLDGIGIGPGTALHRLDAAILADDPTLLTSAPLVGPDGPLAPGAATGGRPGPRPSRVVGREAERDRVVGDLLAPGSALLVVAEAGTGKTALASEVAGEARARGATVLWTEGETAPDGALQPVRQLVAQLVQACGVEVVAGWAGDDLDALAHVAPDLLGTSDPDPLPGPVGPVVGRLLERAAEAAPLVVVVDDAHLVPPSSARALAAAHEVAPATGLLLLARPGRLPGAFTRLAPHVRDLEGLDRDAVAAYLQDVVGRRVAPEVVAHLHRRTGGNPLLLGEIVSVPGLREQLATTSTAAALAAVEQLPDSVASFARQRLDDLAAGTVRVVEAASVLGASVPSELLQAVVGPCTPQVQEAATAGLLVASALPDQVTFRHQLIRDAIHAGTSPGTQAEVHGAAAAALVDARSGSWDRVAHHLVAAGTDPRRALDASRRAADEAVAQFAFREAAEHHATRVALLRRMGRDDGPEIRDAVIDRGEALHQAGDATGGEVLLRAADEAEADGDRDRWGRALLCLCRLGLGTDAGTPDPELSARIGRALQEDLRPDIRAELAGGASLLHSLDADPARCRDLYELAEATARAAAPDALPRVLPYAFLGLAHPDLLDRREQVAEELVRVADGPAARFSGLHQRFSVEVQRGRPGFRATHEELARLGRRMATPGHRWTVAYNAAVVHQLEGDLDAAEAAAAEALAEEGIAPSRRLAIYGVQLVALRRDQGRLAELADDVARLVREQPEVRGWRAVALATAAAAGDRDRVAADHDRLAADDHAGLPDDYTRSAAALLVVEAATTIGDRERTRRSLPLLDGLRGRMSWAGTTTMGSIDLVAARAERLLGHEDRARSSLAAAEALGRHMGVPRLAVAVARERRR